MAEKLATEAAVKHEITQKQVLSKVEDLIDELIKKYNKTHNVPLDWYDVCLDLEQIKAWKK